ncbi:MAG: preprotein translocase subunit SecY [Eubacteriales bacterium]|nr:preprotein translocase subunit SecY [Eubacteriales bacterium]
MLQTIKNAWKIPDLRKKLLSTLMLLVVFRFGSVIPVPFISGDAMQSLTSGGNGGSLINFLDTFSGGAFSNATIFAMSITPYINSSIIMQLLAVAIPALERLQKEGEEGRKILGRYTRYLAVVLGFIEATGLYFAIRNSLTSNGKGVLGFVVITFTFTAGTAFLMWLGEQINEKGIGNGISLLIFAGIVSRGPQAVQALYATILERKTMGWISVAVILLVALAVVTLVVYMNEAERRIPVQYAKRVVGRKMYGGQSTHIPIKLLGAGVIPIIFAMSIMAFPGTVAQFFGKNASSGGFLGGFLGLFSPDSTIYAVCYFLLIIAFSYFYIAIQFNPIEIANNMKKNGGFVPGLRPGKPTSDYIAKIISRITFAGALFLGFLAVFPIVLSRWSPVNITIGGTSLLIVVGVALETTKQMESHMLMRHYKGFLE